MSLTRKEKLKICQLIVEIYLVLTDWISLHVFVSLNIDALPEMATVTD